MASPPNILYVHSHDTGRYVQPYGHQVPTPNIQRLADQGLLFRQAFSAAAVCSGSRAALLTGQASHTTEMLGLAHRGYRLANTNRHLAHTLHDHGYYTVLLGEQHLAADPEDVGYEHVIAVESYHADQVAPAAVDLIAGLSTDRPFFLSVGFFETHRAYFEPTSVRDALYSAPPPNLPDTPEAANLALDPAYETIRAELAARLHAWMAQTKDPLVGGPVPPAPGTVFNLPSQATADDPLSEAPPLAPTSAWPPPPLSHTTESD